MQLTDNLNPLIMILHDSPEKANGIGLSFTEKSSRIESASLDEQGVKKLVQSNCDGVVFLGEPPLSLLGILRENLGHRLLPANFPVFIKHEICPEVPDNSGPGSLDILPFRDAATCIDKANFYLSKKNSTSSKLGWTTVVLLFALLFLALKGAKLFLPPGELETQVEIFKMNDPSDVHLRLLGPLERLNQRVNKMNGFISDPDFYFLPLDLSMFLNSRMEETKNYLRLVDLVVEIPATINVKKIGDIEASLSRIDRLKKSFPKKLESTEGWIFLVEKESFNQKLLESLNEFKSSFTERTNVFNDLSSLDRQQKSGDFDWKPWLDKASDYLDSPWPESFPQALATNIPEVLEMRLADHANRKKIHLLKCLINYLTIPKNITADDFLFKTGLFKETFHTLDKESPNLRKSLTPANFTPNQNETIQFLVFKMKSKIYPILGRRIFENLGDQKTWEKSKAKLLADPVLKEFCELINPISWIESPAGVNPIENIIALLTSDGIQLKCGCVKLVLDNKLSNLLPENPTLNITFEKPSGETKVFNFRLVMNKDHILQSTDVGIDYAYKWFDRVNAVIELKDGSKLVWDKAEHDIFGWSSLLTEGKMVGGSTTFGKLTPSILVFEPKLVALPSLLFKPDN